MIQGAVSLGSGELQPHASSLWHSLRQGPLKVLIIGGGNWGTAIGKIVAQNAAASYIFDSTVHMWLHEETFEGKPLTSVINETHENPRYLPGISLPQNLIAIPELLPVAMETDLLVVVIPHQFVDNVCKELKGNVKHTTKAISLVKGLKICNGAPILLSSVISETLGIPCSILSGANIANDIARDHFSETTLGFDPKEKETAAVWQQLFDTPQFKVMGVPDICGVEVCGAIKNVVALAAGFCDGLNYGTNTKAAILRTGVDEMKLFANMFFDGVVEETFFDSSGYADVITTCFGGRNVRCAAEFVRRGGKDSWEKIEADLLKGQKMQGQLTSKEVYEVINKHDLQHMFPLFTVTYLISFEGMEPSSIVGFFTTDIPRRLKMAEECNACIVPAQLKLKKRQLRNLN